LKKIAIVPAPGLGDAMIFLIAAHHLSLYGYDVTFSSPHNFGPWFPKLKYGPPTTSDAIFLQHDNKPLAKELMELPIRVFAFYGSHSPQKHGPLRPLDYVCNPKETMVDNLIKALFQLFHIPATSETGLAPPPHLTFRKYPRTVLHTSSGKVDANWSRFSALETYLKKHHFEPTILPLFPTLSELFAFLYESSAFIGNDSGPGHVASCLGLPHVILGKNAEQMRLWRPGWRKGAILTAPRFAKAYWHYFIPCSSVRKALQAQM
jgi:heptosyltransferase III